MGVVWATFAVFFAAIWHFWHPLLAMGVVWATFAAEPGRKWHIWHPLLVMGVVWDTFAADSGRRCPVRHPSSVMGVVWATFAAFFAAIWHFWHPLLVMGVVWATFAAEPGRKWPVWHPTLRMGVVRAVSPTAPAPKRPMCTGCVFARTFPRLGPDGGPPAAGSRLRLAPRCWPSRLHASAVMNHLREHKQVNAYMRKRYIADVH